MDRNVRFIPGTGPILDKLTSIKTIEVFAQQDLTNKYRAVGRYKENKTEFAK